MGFAGANLTVAASHQQQNRGRSGQDGGQSNRASAQQKRKKGGPPFLSFRTRRPSWPIISSLKALFARRLFRPRAPIRSFVSLLGACLRESGATALMLARLYTSPPRRISGSSRKRLSAASELILLLLKCVVNGVEFHRHRGCTIFQQTATGFPRESIFLGVHFWVRIAVVVQIQH